MEWLNNTIKSDSKIPNCDYNENVVNFYKLAIASRFPGQSFIAYYNILEFFFLNVYEDNLHHQIKSKINDTKFSSSNNEINDIISIVRGLDSRSGEEQLLRKVLERYIRKDDLIKFIQDIETKSGERIYSKKRLIFGEEVGISLSDDQYIYAHTSNVLKHLRNSLVHSTDKYSRSERHIPLSESDERIREYIPLVRFCAEKVIFGTTL